MQSILGNITMYQHLKKFDYTENRELWQLPVRLYNIKLKLKYIYKQCEETSAYREASIAGRRFFRVIEELKRHRILGVSLVLNTDKKQGADF